MKYIERVKQAAHYVWQAIWIIPAFVLLALAAVCVAAAYCSIRVGLVWFHDARSQ